MFPGDDYLGDDTVHHKSQIPKIMFLRAIGVSHHRADGSFFDGKIGIWAFTEQVAAKRSSINRPAGTLEIKGVNVDAAKHSGVLEMNTKHGGVLDAIRRKHYHLKDESIFVQHDRAKPHTGKRNMEKLNAAGFRNN